MELNVNLKNRFLTLIKNGKLSHSYIIVGGEGAGKLELALYCAQAILCGGAPCGNCDDCRKTLNGSHPDIRVIDQGESATFKIEDVRRVVESINIPPNEGKRKIYILNRCENMTVQGQNALLKAFEEPPEYVVFFILAEKKEALLPTVRSRATIFTIHPMGEDEVEKGLKEKYPKENDDDINNAARLSEGFFGKAVRFLEKSSKEERKNALSLSNHLLGEKSGYKAAVLLNGYKNKREGAIRLLFLTLYAVRDTILYKKGYSKLCLLTADEALEYSKNSTEELVKISEAIVDTATSLENNGNYTSCTAKLCGIIK